MLTKERTVHFLLMFGDDIGESVPHIHFSPLVGGFWPHLVNSGHHLRSLGYHGSPSTNKYISNRNHSWRARTLEKLPGTIQLPSSVLSFPAAYVICSKGDPEPVVLYLSISSEEARLQLSSTSSIIF
jgi:hypothetical protein